MQRLILKIIIDLVLVNFGADGVDTISDDNKVKVEESFRTKMQQRHLASKQEPKLMVAGVGDVGIGHGHGHLHHPNKVNLLRFYY